MNVQKLLGIRKVNRPGIAKRCVFGIPLIKVKWDIDKETNCHYYIQVIVCGIRGLTFRIPISDDSVTHLYLHLKAFELISSRQNERYDTHK